jgi:phospholipid transport system substrate-binding protein
LDVETVKHIQSESTMTMRRRSLFLLGLTTLLWCQAPSLAAKPALPERFAQAEIDRLAKILATASPSRLESLRAELRTVIDFDGFAERTMGPRWADLTAEQRRGVRAALQDLLESAYLSPRASQFDKDRCIIKKTDAEGENRRVYVTLKDPQADIAVVFKLRPQAGAWLAYDVVVDGMSLVADYRTQFQAFLKTKSVDELIARLHAKAKGRRSPKAR